MVTDKEIIKQRLARRVNSFYPSPEEVISRLAAGEPLKFYLGIDPTGTQVHLGHTVPLLLLKDLADLGHQVTLLIGDFTARIGDPTDKLATRVPLTETQVKQNMETYVEQVEKILPQRSFKLEYNSRWLEKLKFVDILQLASLVSVQQLLARDMFQERIKQEKSIGLHEFLYPLMQGYDSVAMAVDGEVGGNDQLFNMLIGRKLEKELLNKDKIVLTTRLLIDANRGKKMSKSEGGLIAINDSPADIFGKVMSTIPDEMVKTVFELCTQKTKDEIQSLASGHPKAFKLALAQELVQMYHNLEVARGALEEFEKVFSQGDGVPKTTYEFITGGKSVTITVVIKDVLGTSMTEAKTYIDQGAVSTVLPGVQKISSWDFAVKPGTTIKVGAHRFIRIK